MIRIALTITVMYILSAWYATALIGCLTFEEILTIIFAPPAATWILAGIVEGIRHLMNLP